MDKNLTINFSTESKILSGLNEAQKQAVCHKQGPLLVIAGAGTGKTSVITRRIAYIIEQKWALPSEILALTFTEKAAAEMEERVDLLVPYGFTDMWISTFHAFGDRFLRDHSLDMGLPANFRVLSATEQSIFMKQRLFAFDLRYYRPVASPTSHINSLLNHFSRLKDELITPDQYLDSAQAKMAALSDPNEEERQEAEKGLELANAYVRYSELMMQSGNLDYGDQIYLTYKLLKDNPTLLKEIRSRFKYILVDEFQDTNHAQNMLVKLISGGNGNITAVGDDDQSIYRFRGASISNILQFKEQYQDITQIVLNQNYRSTQEILDASYRLIQHNNPDRLEVKNNIDKRLVSDMHGPKPELLHCATLTCEADKVVSTIIEIKKREDFAYKDFAILVRANSQADPFIQSLNLAGVPYIFSGTSSLLQKTEIRIAISFLRCLANPQDNLSFFHLATSEVYDTPSHIVAALYAKAKTSNRDIESIIDDEDPASPLYALKAELGAYRNLMKSHKAGEILYKFLNDKGVIKGWIDAKSIEGEIKVYNMAAFFTKIANFDNASEDKSVLAFLDALEMIIEAGDDSQSSEIDSEIDAVNILTAHSAKGLEYKCVFVINAVSDRFPSKNRKEPIPLPDDLINERLPQGDFHLQEERRLFYVAATRAKQYLYITAADDYGGKRVKKLSPFVLELFDQVSSDTIKHKLSPEQKIARFNRVISEPTSPMAVNKRKENLRLSRQQIDDYFTCPQKYYLAHVIKIPLLENHYLMYGTAIHAALNHHFTKKMKRLPLSLEELLDSYKKCFNNVGFITREHEELRYQQGVETLSKFFISDQSDKRVPQGVESSFEFIQDEVKVNGRYDLIFGDQNEVEICDFKTSAVKDQKDAQSRIRKSTQMQMYALSWQKKFGIVPKTTLYFIESGLKAERTFEQKELDKTEEMISEVAKGIKEQNYNAKPSPRDCEMCAYKEVCPDSLA